MSRSVIERLRQAWALDPSEGEIGAFEREVMLDAADEIERLRAALENFASSKSRRSQLLRDAADSCDELAAEYRRDAVNMGPTKEAQYVRMAVAIEDDVKALIAWAEELPAEPGEKP